MKMPKPIIASAALATIGLTLAACDSDSAAENQVEAQAEAIDESYEAEADLIESLEAGGPNEEVAEAKADQLREKGEEVKDHLEDMADELDESPQ